MNFAPMVFNVGAIKINSTDHMSVQMLGVNQQADLYFSNKRNQGFGDDNGDLSQVNFPFSLTSDNDGSDGNSQKSSLL